MSGVKFVTFFICISITQITADFKCEKPGKFAHQNQKMYHECTFVGDNKYTHAEHSCPGNGCFDGAEQTCDPDHCGSSMKPKPDGGFTCTAPGKFPHPDKSKKGSYYKCVNDNGKYQTYQYECLPTKPCFNSQKQSCQAC